MIQTNTLEVGDKFKVSGMFECARMGEIVKLPSPRILSIHLRPEYLPKVLSHATKFYVYCIMVLIIIQ